MSDNNADSAQDLAPSLEELGSAVIESKTRKERKEAKRTYYRAEEKAVMKDLAKAADQAVVEYEPISSVGLAHIVLR